MKKINKPSKIIKKSEKKLANLLVVLFGPIGMFYWGIRTGFISSLVVIILRVIIHALGINNQILVLILIRIPFLFINYKIPNKRHDQNIKSKPWLFLIANLAIIGMIPGIFVALGWLYVAISYKFGSVH